MTYEQRCVKQMGTSLHFVYEAAEKYLQKGIII